MAERLSPRALGRQVYVPENDPDWVKGQELIGPEAAWRRNYEYVLNKTGSAETARAYADSIARTEMRQGISGAAPGLISGGVGVVNALRGVGGGRNAMTAAEMLVPETRALPAPRPGPSSPVGRGTTGEPIPGTSAERAPRLPYQEYKPDVRSVPDEYAMFEGEGGLTSDAIAEARRLARERIAAEKAFRQNQLATMEGEGGGAQAAGEARARAAAADRAAMEAAINAAESEGMGAAIGAGRRQPGTSLVPAGTRDVVPARTPATDLEALMNRHFGGGETGGLPARGPTYYSDLPNAGPRLVGESFAGESPAYNVVVTRNQPGGIPDWLKYGAPAGAALAGGTYLAAGRDQEPAREPRFNMFDETNIGAPQFAPAQQDTARMASDILRQYGMNAFTQPKAETAAASSAIPAGHAAPPPRPERKERGFLDRLIGQPSQSMGGELMQDGRINWGSGESAADFVRAAQAMRKMQDEGRKFEDIQGINPELEGRKSGGKVDEDKSLKKALEIIHHLVKR